MYMFIYLVGQPALRLKPILKHRYIQKNFMGWWNHWSVLLQSRRWPVRYSKWGSV